jgi:imidazolonepropionase-like amidohydrolase
VVIRDGVIEAVGASVAVPADARVWELDSLTVYPGLIDLGMVLTSERKPSGAGRDQRGKKEEGSGGFGHELDVVTPERVLAEDLSLKVSEREGRRSQGFTTARVLPDRGTLRGQAAILNLGDGALSRNLLQKSAGQVMAFSGAPGGDDYPNSTMGVVAVIRQTLYDTRWYEEAHSAYAADPVGKERPPANAAFEALVPAVNRRTPIIFVTDDVLDILRAHEMGREFDLTFEYLGSGEEYKRLSDIKGIARNLVVPVDFPEAPKVDDGPALEVSLEKLRQWNNAPTNPFLLYEAGVTFALTANGLKDKGQFRENVAKAIEAGLPEDVALASLTTVPAAMTGMSDRMGTVDRGKIANLVITDGELFSEKTKIRAVWIDGAHYEVDEVKPPKGDPRGTWSLVADAGADERHPITLVLGGEVGSLTATITLMETEVTADATQSGNSVIITFAGDAIGLPGTIRFSFEFKEDNATGSGVTAEGESFSVSGTRTAKPEPDPSRGGARQ